VTTSCAILTRECVGWGAILKQARLFNACRLGSRSRKSLRAGLHAPHRRCALDDAVKKLNPLDATKLGWPFALV
jgi:hypothetical protein